MTEAVLLPTRKDEAWRYSDTEALEGMDLGTFDEWRDIEVPAGESFRDSIVIADSDGLSDATELRRLRITVRKDATCEIFGVIASGRLGRVEMVVTVEEGGHFEFGGVTLGGRDTTREFVTRIAHDHPNATSNQVVRGVHWGQGTGNFLGRIDVARDAQKVDAKQDFKGLLLDRGAATNAKPELEIYADDVKCAHGAAVGQMDEMARYYMAARGIPPQTAKALLIRAFIADAFANLDDEAERERLFDAALARIEEWL